MRFPTLLTAAVLAVGSPVAMAQAEKYPERPIRMIVAWAAGGGTDTPARIVAKAMSQQLSVPIAVENRDGASGMIGTEYVANAPGDGYVIQYTVADSHSVNPHLFSNIRYDPLKDFVPVGVVGYGPCVLVVNANLPIRSLDDLISVAKQKPEGISFATWGVGSGGHVRMAALMDAAGIRFLHVPYKGSAPALMAVAGGEVQSMIVPASMAKAQAQAGRVRMLAIDTTERYGLTPDVPTYSEQGFDLNLRFWHAVYAPKGTPPAIVARLNRALNAALDDPGTAAELERKGIVRLRVGDGSASAAKDYLDSEYLRWGKVIKGANIRLD
jgi:tripartite-type tricarboxylate transporter receptor subunit TctC